MCKHSSLCLLMLAGQAPSGLALQELQALIPQRPYVVAADGGANHLAKFGLLPQLWVGDGDSLDYTVKEKFQQAGVDFQPLPREKDFTDGEAALQAALAKGYRDFAVFGALGGNLDHQLGNLLLPLAYRQYIEKLIFYGEDCRASYCFGHSSICGSPGDTISLLPLSPQVKGLNLQGFRYPLNNDETILGSSLCLRNELTQSQGQIDLAQGIMLIIHYPANPEIL